MPYVMPIKAYIKIDIQNNGENPHK